MFAKYIIKPLATLVLRIAVTIVGFAASIALAAWITFPPKKLDAITQVIISSVF